MRWLAFTVSGLCPESRTGSGTAAFYVSPARSGHSLLRGVNGQGLRTLGQNLFSLLTLPFPVKEEDKGISRKTYRF
jgi:hypothetical protein